jgi:hypothetical protein
MRRCPVKDCISSPLLNPLLGCGSLLAMVSLTAHAQQPADSVGAPVPSPARFVPSLILDNRNSFVQASAVRIIGLNLGLTPRGKHYRLGLAGYTLRRS